MGVAFEGLSVFAETLRSADRALGFRLSALCFEGPEEELTRTEFAQPALLATSVGIYPALQKAGAPPPSIVAGHSLGEYSALCAAEAISLEEVLPLVRLRGKLMQETVPLGTGGMSAVLGMGPDQVDAICRESGLDVVAANLNAPEQVVISGRLSAIEAITPILKERGAKRVMPLAVSAPFHSPLLEPMVGPFGEALRGVAWKEPSAPLCANVDALLKRSPESIISSLTHQVTSPVRWVDVCRRLVTEGVTTVVEVGTRSVLTALIKRCAPELTLLAVTTPEEFNRAVETLN